MTQACVSSVWSQLYEQMSLLVVMLYDFQDRKFLPRKRQGEELVQEVQDVEDYLHR